MSIEERSDSYSAAIRQSAAASPSSPSAASASATAASPVSPPSSVSSPPPAAEAPAQRAGGEEAKGAEAEAVVVDMQPRDDRQNNSVAETSVDRPQNANAADAAGSSDALVQDCVDFNALNKEVRPNHRLSTVDGRVDQRCPSGFEFPPYTAASALATGLARRSRTRAPCSPVSRQERAHGPGRRSSPGLVTPETTAEVSSVPDTSFPFCLQPEQEISVVSRQVVKKGREHDFEDYVRRVANTAHKFPGTFTAVKLRRLFAPTPRAPAMRPRHARRTSLHLSPEATCCRAPPHKPHQAGAQLARVPHHLPLRQQGEPGEMARLSREAQVRRRGRRFSAVACSCPCPR